MDGTTEKRSCDMSFYDITIVEPVTSCHQILDLDLDQWCGVCMAPVYELYILTQIFNIRTSCF